MRRTMNSLLSSADATSSDSPVGAWNRPAMATCAHPSFPLQLRVARSSVYWIPLQLSGGVGVIFVGTDMVKPVSGTHSYPYAPF